uniref:AAA family ATPase n=1 Tax=Candidatus Limisoma sp. TaxID=3076476 RepID=UPI003FEE6C13
MELTGLQLAVVEQVCRFIKDENAQVFILKGYAGTGKTTLVKTIADKISQWLTVKLMAPTGRAARVLSDKTGREATTIHRAIYKAEGLKEGKAKSDFKFHFLLNDTSG